MGFALNIAGALLMALGLPGLPRDLRGWRRWLIAWLSGDEGRLVLVSAGVGLSWLGVLLGTSVNAAFGFQVSALIVAWLARLYVRRRGMEGWIAACDWEEGADHITLMVWNERDMKASRLRCWVYHPTGRFRHASTEYTLTETDNAPTSSADCYYPHATQFPDAPRPPNMPNGWYRVEWWSERGVNRTLIRRHLIRVKKGQPRCFYPKRMDPVPD
jgi:hypothetical protein